MAAHPALRAAAAFPTLLLILCLALCLATAAAAAPPGVVVPVRALDGGGLAAPVRLGGVTAWMLVDTGATRSRIRAELAARLELRPTARHAIQTLDDVERTALCHGPIALDLAGLELLVECLSWSAALPIPLGLDGVLGADALAGADFLLDGAAERLRVAAAGSLLAWVDGAALPARIVEGRPAVAASWQTEHTGATELAGHLVLDSGADAPIFFGELARALSTSQRAAARPVVRTAGDAVAAWTIRLGSLQVGSRALRRLDTVLLPSVDDRREAGLLPPSLLGPTLFALADGVVVADARLRRQPRAEPVWLAAATAVPIRLETGTTVLVAQQSRQDLAIDAPGHAAAPLSRGRRIGAEVAGAPAGRRSGISNRQRRVGIPRARDSGDQRWYSTLVSRLGSNPRTARRGCGSTPPPRALSESRSAAAALDADYGATWEGY